MDSHLTDPHYGYDFVVSTTQASINSSMKHFLATRSEPTVTVCYVANDDGLPVPIDFKQLLVESNNTDPFTIEDSAGPGFYFNPDTDPRVQNLKAARFMMGFRATMGIPPMTDRSKTPDIVTLGSDTRSVGFNLLCSEFDVVEYRPGTWTMTRWFHASQQQDHPFIFHSTVDIRVDEVDRSQFDKLPPDVRAKIKNFGPRAFSVQQLLYDFDNAGLQSVPSIEGIEPGSLLYSTLEQFFIGAYFTQMQKEGHPVLSCAAKVTPDPSQSWQMTDFDLQANPYLGDSPDFSTLSFLCMVDGHKQQPAYPFNFNWVPATSNPDHDGMVAMNRNTFTQYLDSKLRPMAPKYCLKPITHCYEDVGVQYRADFTPNQQPSVEFPGSGPVLVRYGFHGDDENAAGLDGNLGSLHIATDYRLDVTVSGNQVVVTQHLTIYLWVRHFTTSKEGNIIDRVRVDTCTIAVNADGGLMINAATTKDDHDENVRINGFLSAIIGFKHVVDAVEDAVKNSVDVDLNDAVNLAPDFVFPGGKTFTYKDPVFSNNQDLLVSITYTQ